MASNGVSKITDQQNQQQSAGFVGVVGGGSGVIPARAQRSVLEAGSNGEKSSLVLAEKRTRRKDPINDFKYYNGGWNISNDHYISSVSFTAVPLFGIAAIWFAGFGKFHKSTSDTLDFVVRQSKDTVHNLNNVLNILATAKGIGVDQVSLPSDMKNNIDRVDKMINDAARDLDFDTKKNEKHIHDVLNSMYTFTQVHNDHCLDLRKYSKWVYIGLAMVSAAVMHSLVLWVLYARERRHRKYTKLAVVGSGQSSFATK
ncbi:hypothetical protein Ccrd_022697 [Cynara cardunculus var. scolymus]|uniref:Uncharacterized protein n=1 Tax=Cynara cardunculus var. scolymus TaxID=59895 RepID=A0A103XY73_CYNCS|nr:hypothetical protein Ccrd_022697 [Cynara cardunculus var. scolymus]